MSNRLRMMRFAAAAALAASWRAGVAVAEGPVLKPVPRGMATVSSDKLRSGMVDIALGSDRTLRGRFVDSGGAAIDGAVVTLKQSDRVIARSTTLADGSFKIDRVSTGAYKLTCGSAGGQIRCWTTEAAPPYAVVDGVTFQDSVVRGQAGAIAPALFGTRAVTAAAASATAIGGVAVYTASDHKSSSSSTAPTDTTSTASDPQLPTHRATQFVSQDPQARLMQYDPYGRWSQYEQSGKAPPNITLPSDWRDANGLASP